MNSNISIDVLEDDIIRFDRELLGILLKDRTTQKNIIWATDDYVNMGEIFASSEQITPEKITGQYAKIIQPRVLKEKDNQSKRTRKRAEVFTPSWICNEQNNLVDECWFGRKNIFNTSTGNSWITKTEKIEFPEDKKHSWQKYVDARRLEISCGEAPYLVSRYDTVTGDLIEITDRIGLLDRKLRVVNENTEDDTTWFKWTKRAFQSIYGYEYQGDNLLIARENLLYTFIDYYKARTDKDIPIRWLKHIAAIISWNIWQMDGITNTVPLHSKHYYQISLFDLFDESKDVVKIAQPCRIQDWRSKMIVPFESLMKG